MSAAPRLRVAVIGTGRWGKNLVRVFCSLAQAELVSVCDVDPVTLAALETRAERVTDYRHILDDRRIDAVVIATPPHTHADLAVASFEAGKHVFVEKPMALCSADAWRVVRAAEKAGKRGMVGYVMLHHPAITQVKQWIDDGVLGDIRRIVAVRRGPPGGPHEPGPWWSLAPHDVSLACFLLEGEPLSVAVTERREGTIEGRLRFADDCIVDISVGTDSLAKVRRLAVGGTRRVAFLDETAHREQSAEPLLLEAAHFVDGVLDDKRLRSDIAEGARVVRLLEAGIASPWSSRQTRGLSLLDDGPTFSS